MESAITILTWLIRTEQNCSPNKPDEATKRANWQKVINECNTFFSNYGSRYHLMYTNKDGVSVSGPDSKASARQNLIAVQ